MMTLSFFVAIPTFTNYSEYSPADHCYVYEVSSLIIYKQEVDMTVYVSEGNVTLIWYTHKDGIIKCDHYPCEEYLLSKDNKVKSRLV